MSEPINKRTPQIWQLITQMVDPYSFGGLRVLDIGAGYGDLAICMANMAAQVVAVEKNKAVAKSLRERISKRGFNERIKVLQQDVESFEFIWPEPIDVIVCTSVLPYLTAPNRIMSTMSIAADVAFIECQYAGDGPGFPHIEDDEDMINWLERYWPTVIKVGETAVDIRPASRSIWLCESLRILN